eukprot:1182105-Prorocentrum_minimum.AAC.4
MRGAAEGAAQPVPCPMRLCHCATVSLCHCVTVSLYSRGHIPSILRRRALPRTVPLRLCAVLRMCSKRKDGGPAQLRAFREAGGGRILCRILLGPMGAPRQPAATWQEEAALLEAEDRERCARRSLPHAWHISK